MKNPGRMLLIGVSEKFTDMFSDKLDYWHCAARGGFGHAAMTTAVRHSGAGWSPGGLDTKLI